MRTSVIAGLLGLAAAVPVSAQVQITEVRIGQPGVDSDLYIEFAGAPGTDLGGLDLIVIGDLEGQFPPAQNGGVEFVASLNGTIGPSGRYVLASGTYSLGTPDQIVALTFEQGDNLTIILADGYTGSVGDDVDANDDGTLDPKAGIVAIDSIAILANANPDGFSSDFYYSDETVGPVAGFPPLHSWQCEDTLVWRPGQDALGSPNETPGEVNPECDGGGGGPEGLILSELRFDHTGADSNEFVEIQGDPFSSLDGVAYIVIGDGSAAQGSGVVENVTLMDTYSIGASGYFVIAKSTFALGQVDLVYDDLAHENSDTLTAFLVQGFTGAIGDDLDLDDDGVLDVIPWSDVYDSVTVLETCEEPPTTTEWGYSDTIVRPNGIYVAGGIYRCEPTLEWVVGDFVDYASEHTPGSVNLDCENPGCGGLARSCFEAQNGPGCSDVVLCALVCNADPACCTAEWDSNCAGLASSGYLVDGDAPGQLTLNELRTKQPGAPDTDEYFEIKGEPGQSLDGLSVIILGGDGCEPEGVVIEQYNLWGQTVPSSGYFVMGDSTLSLGTGFVDYELELDIIDGGNLTFALAWNFTGAKGQVLDTDASCSLDLTPWQELAGDVVASYGDGSMNCTYLGAIEIGPDGIYSPGHLYRCGDGKWDWSSFDPSAGTDSPGLENPECGAPPAICGDPAAGSCFEAQASGGCDDAICCDTVSTMDPYCVTDRWDDTCVSHAFNLCSKHSPPADASIVEIRTDQPGSDNDEYVEIRADSGTDLTGLTIVVIGDGAGGSGSVDTIIPLGNVFTDGDGIALLGQDSLTLGTSAYPARFVFENQDNVTFLLVYGYTGTPGMDLDTDDDGVLDVTPWDLILDSVSLIETVDPATEGGDLYYGDVVVGPAETIDGDIFVPAQAWQCSDNGEWNIGVFDPASLDPEPTDTAGVLNPDCGGSCEGDFNDDGQVNGADFGSLLAAWGVCGGCPEDLNGDGIVSGADVGLLLSVWGSCP